MKEKKLPVDFTDKDIIEFLQKWPQLAFTEKDFKEFQQNHTATFPDPEKVSTKALIDHLVKAEKLKMYTFTDEEKNYKYVYSVKTTDPYNICFALKENCWFSFQSALFLNNLTSQTPKNFYLNSEHKAETIPKTPSTLSQQSIDTAFSKPQRKSSLGFTFLDKTLHFTQGKFSNKLGILSKRTLTQQFDYTDVERTLIDCVVRPAYAGGVYEVMHAFRLLRNHLNTEKLHSYLKQMNFLYPYHQLIGFYMHKAGFNPRDYERFNTHIVFDFYLSYDIKNKDYDPLWKVYFPRGL